MQRKYSKYKGKRTKQKLAILHEKVANQRKDFLHKTSSELIKNHDSLAIEDLAVSNMMKNHKLAGSIQDAGWGNFLRMLEYKCSWYGKTFIRVNPAYTSQICPQCGNKHKANDRKYKCPNCGFTAHRDRVGAMNIIKAPIISGNSLLAVSVKDTADGGVLTNPNLGVILE